MHTSVASILAAQRTAIASGSQHPSLPVEPPPQPITQGREGDVLTKLAETADHTAKVISSPLTGIQQVEYPFDVEDRGIQSPLGYRTLILRTPCGSIETRLYGLPNATHAILVVGGVGGGFDTPGNDLYPRLGSLVAADPNLDAVLLRVCFRDPSDLKEAVYDLNEGVVYLRSHGVRRFGLVGHSFGGAVVLQSAAKNADVCAVVTVATQGYGAEISSLGVPGRAVLFVHGDRDEVLPWAISHRLFEQTPGKQKYLKIFKGSGHCVDKGDDPEHLFQTIRDFIIEQLLHEQ